jgi:hypothetical protein
MNAPPNDNPEMLFKEYEICIKEASRLESNIWQTALIFSIGSGVGLTYFLKEYLIDKGDSIKLGSSVSLFAFFVIIISLVWWRMAKRWWSIQQLKYERMEMIERYLGFSQISMVGERDTKIKQHIKSYRFIYLFKYKIPKNINAERCNYITKIKDYEHRGIQPAIKYLLLSNAILWIFLILTCYRIQEIKLMKVFDIFSNVLKELYYGKIFLILPLILIVLFLYFWRKP